MVRRRRNQTGSGSRQTGRRTLVLPRALKGNCKRNGPRHRRVWTCAVLYLYRPRCPCCTPPSGTHHVSWSSSSSSSQSLARASLWPVPFALWRCVNGLFTKDVRGENHCTQCLSWASFRYLVNAGLSPREVLAGTEIPGGGGCGGSDRGRGWGRGWVAGRRGGGGYNTITTISLIPSEGFCITMGSGVSPFNVLLWYTRTLTPRPPPPAPPPSPLLYVTRLSSTPPRPYTRIEYTPSKILFRKPSSSIPLPSLPYTHTEYSPPSPSLHPH